MTPLCCIPFHAGLSLHPVHDVGSCEAVMERGWKNRSVGATLMNADSSRSHSVFTIHLEQMELTGRKCIRSGKLNLVDLAGSERQAKTGMGTAEIECASLEIIVSCAN